MTKKRLSEKELREEYVSHLKEKRRDMYVEGVGLFTAITGIIIWFAPKWWKIISVIPITVIILTARQIKKITLSIKANKEGK